MNENTYNRITHQFSLYDQLIHIDRIDDDHVYDLIKRNKITMDDFKSWYAYKLSRAYQQGMEFK
jgi:hypothetical protein